MFLRPAARSVLEAEVTASTNSFDLVGNEFDNTITGNNGQNVIVGGPASTS